MLIPIRCFTCGSPTVGEVATLFRRMRADRTAAALAARGTTPAQAAIDARLEIKVDDILTQLGVDMTCCRMHLATAMVYSDYH